MSETINIKRMQELVNPSAQPSEQQKETFYPVTHEKAVRDDNGTTLETKLQTIEANTQSMISSGLTEMEELLDNAAVRYDQPQSLTSEEKAQALANVGISGVDDVPTHGSDNLVKSGGVADELALGAVYDVSAHNSGATFASLSALLSDASLNTLIPSAVRKGGMSIKFVQSSDNKYVQYMYKVTDAATAATFTNVANWQGVDELKQGATVLKDSPTAYLKNVKYGKEDKGTKISLYNNGHDLDKPLPIEVTEDTIIYQEPISQVPAEGLLIRGNLAYNFVPGRCYYFKDGSETLLKTIVPSRRFIWANTVRNIRDFGGMEVSHGTVIRYNAIFRGSEICGSRIPYSEVSNDALKTLGIDVDIDLRNPSEIPQQNNPLGVEYVNIPFIQFADIQNISDTNKKIVKEAFEVIASKVLQGKQIYIHCAIGFHRCGLLSSIIAGVLGVSQGELDKDYELSTFSELMNASRVDSSYVTGVHAIENEYSGSWESFILACGVSASLVNDFKEYMLYTKSAQLDTYTEITYSDLKNLVLSESLTPVGLYRITDYETLVDSYSSLAPYGPTEDKVMSYKKPFDLVVQAVSTSELSVWAHAVHSKRDVEGYFVHEDLSKWVIKYDIFNNKDRYEWALTEGKGVIYYMSDAFGNEAGYDFKNIAFKYKDDFILSIPRPAKNVSFGEYLDITGVRKLNFHVITGHIATNVRIGKNSYNVALVKNCSSVDIGEYCSDITLQDADLCKVGKSCSNISIMGQAYSVTIGEECSNIKVKNVSTEKALIIEPFTHDKEGAVIAEYTKLENGIDYNTELTPLENLTRFTYIDGTEKVLLIEGELSNNKVPDSINLKSVDVGLYVTSIGEYAFSNCYNLTAITLPDSLTYIGKSAFYNCYGLTSITIPNSVTSIGERAFSGCSGLTSITIPNTVTSIGEFVFSFCSGLTSITIPNSVTSIDYGAFYDCTSLTSITIGNSVTNIGSSAFLDCTRLTSITLPSSVTTIGNNAFYNCSNIQTITSLALSAPSIDSTTFSGVGVGGTLIVEEGATGYDEWMRTDNYYLGLYNWTLIEKYYGFVKLKLSDDTEVEIEGSGTLTTEQIQPYKITVVEATIGKQCTSIGNSAFLSCTSLTSITIPNSVTSIGKQVFRYCSSLNSIIVDTRNTIYDSRGGCNAIIEKETNTLISGCQNTIIPGSVTCIGEYAFIGCNSLTSIIIPNSVTIIGRAAFESCRGLTSVTIPNSVTDISENAFSNCISLTSINIPNSVTSIGEYAFQNCRSLTSITIPEGVTSIEIGAFKGCSGLTSITIPNSVTSIGNSAFEGCTSLTSITIPNSVTSIGEYAFQNCSNIEDVIIEGYVESIGVNAFYQPVQDSKLESIEFRGGVGSMGKAVLWGCVNCKTIKYNSTTLPTFNSDETWGSVTATNAVGYNHRSEETNVFYCPSSSVYTEAQIDNIEGGYLFNQNIGGFSLSRIL